MNNNGHISFDGPVSTYTPVPFPLNGSGFDATQLIAPYWADADTRPGGTVWYRESSSQADLSRAQSEIRDIFPGEADRFSPHLVFIVTWDHIGYYDQHYDKVHHTVTSYCSYCSI